MIELPDLLDESRLGFRPRELARALDVSEQMVRTWFATGVLDAKRIGCSLFVTPSTLRQKGLLPPGLHGGGDR